MKPLLFALPSNEDLTARLVSRLDADVGSLETRYFPDGETYVRLDCDVAARSVVLVCTLDRPDEKTLRLLFAAGARQIVSTNAVPHVSNAIDLSDLIQGASRQFTEGNEVSLHIRGRNR